MVTIRSTGCCGLRELDQLGTEPDAPTTMLNLRPGFTSGDLRNLAFILFTGVSTRHREDHTGVRRADDYGGEFAAWITEHDLGKVIKTDEIPNPKTGNGLTCWLWTPWYPAIHQWYTKWDAEHPPAPMPKMEGIKFVGEPGAPIDWAGLTSADYYYNTARQGRTYGGRAYTHPYSINRDMWEEYRRILTQTGVLGGTQFMPPATSARITGIATPPTPPTAGPVADNAGPTYNDIVRNEG